MANKENGPFLFFSKIYYTAVLKKKKLDFIFNFFFKTHAIISMLKFRSSWICVRNVMCVCDSYTFILGSVIKFHQPIPFKSVVITCIHSRVSVYSLNFRISIIDIRNCRLEARAHGVGMATGGAAAMCFSFIWYELLLLNVSVIMSRSEFFSFF